jgi:hypothetical protein
LITVSALPLADGPAYYFGSTIMTFALPFGAFIAAAIALFYLFRAGHSRPRLRWSADTGAPVSSVTTWEPGPAPAPEVIAGAAASPAPDPLEEDVLAEHAVTAEPAAEEAAPTTGTAPEATEGEE